MKKEYFSPEFDFIRIQIIGNIMNSNPEDPLPEHEPGEEIDD